MASAHQTESDRIGELPRRKQVESGTLASPDQQSHESHGQPVPLGRRLLGWLIVVVAISALFVLAYRWAGTSTLRGTVQRVYEKDAQYRIDFVDSSGEVHVLENDAIKFPHLKTDTADLQAELHRFSETGDEVDVTAWGFRAPFISIFPNIVDVEFVRSDTVRKKEHVRYITQSVINELIDQGVVERGEESKRMRPGLEKAVGKATAKPSQAEREDASSPKVEP